MTSMMPPWMIGTPKYIEKASDFTTSISRRTPKEGDTTRVNDDERELWKEFKADFGDKTTGIRAMVEKALDRMDPERDTRLSKMVMAHVATLEDKARTFHETVPREYNEHVRGEKPYTFSNDEVDSLNLLVKGMWDSATVIQDMLEGVYYKTQVQGKPQPWQLARTMIYDANRWENEPEYIMPARPSVAPPPGIMPPRWERFNFNREETTNLVAQLNMMDDFGYSSKDQATVMQELYWSATGVYGKIRIMDQDAADALTQRARQLPGLDNLDFSDALRNRPPPGPIEPPHIMYGLIDSGNLNDIRSARDYMLAARNAIEPTDGNPAGGGLTQPMSMVMASLGDGARTPSELDAMIAACNEKLGE